MLIANNLTPRITLPTRITDNSATLIDHTDINNSVAGTITIGITYHYSNFIILDHKFTS